MLPELQSELLAALRLAGAFLLALPLGYDREVEDRSAGLRTFPLVAMTSCAFVLVGLMAFANESSMAHVAKGVIGGLGFLGGGAILKNGGNVQGMATAASLWCAGALGVACAFDLWILAVCLAAANFGVLFFGRQAKKNIDALDDPGKGIQEANETSEESDSQD